jgi:Domain of unknown function (DUF4338)
VEPTEYRFSGAVVNGKAHRCGLADTLRTSVAVTIIATFVDPKRFHGGVYRAVNWIDLGLTQGYRRVRKGYSAEPSTPKRVFVRLLCRNVRIQLNQPKHPLHRKGGPKIMLNAEQMRLLPECFKTIPDPRRSQGRSQLATRSRPAALARRT